MPYAHIRVENLRELEREVRKAAGPGAVKALRRANIKIVAPVVAEAKREVPKRTTRLERSIGGGASARSAWVKAGTASRVPYAGPINFGWPGASMSRALARSRSPKWAAAGRKGVRGIAGDHFLDDSVRKELPFITSTYERELRHALDGIDPS